MKNLIALAITLALDSTQEEIDAAHEAIDQFFSGDTATVTATAVAADQAAATTTTAPAANGNVELDSDGLPWDERIHSSNKKLNAKKQWWGRRGVDAALKAKVEGELRAALAAGGAASSAPVTLGTGPALAASGPSLGVVGATVQKAAPSAFELLVADIAKHTNNAANPNGILTDTFVKSVLEWKQVPDGAIQNLAHMGDTVIGEIRAYLAEQLATKGVQF